MASTSQLLTWIELETGWNREGSKGTRSLLNEAHRLLMHQECEQNIIWDESTGNLPYLVTSNKTYRYNMPDTVWRVKAILVDETSDIDSSLLHTNTDWKFEDYLIGGMTFKRIRNVRSRDYTRGANAWVQFIGVNPGAASTTYRRLCYRRPTEITSDTIQHDLPGSADMDYLLPATISLIETINDHKKFAETREYIRTVLKPLVFNDMDGGEQGLSDFCTKRAY